MLPGERGKPVYNALHLWPSRIAERLRAVEAHADGNRYPMEMCAVSFLETLRDQIKMGDGITCDHMAPELSGAPFMWEFYSHHELFPIPFQGLAFMARRFGDGAFAEAMDAAYQTVRNSPFDFTTWEDQEELLFDMMEGFDFLLGFKHDQKVYEYVIFDLPFQEFTTPEKQVEAERAEREEVRRRFPFAR